MWFAMRATYNRALAAQSLIEDAGMQTFVPIKYCKSKRRSSANIAPLLGNLIFVYAEPERIQQFKARYSYLQYITNTRTHERIVVPDSQMARFIAVCGSQEDQLIWLAPEEINLTRGQRVRITGGEFEGYEGVYVKVAGARARRIVVEIKGVVAVALAAVHPSLIEVVE